MIMVTKKLPVNCIGEFLVSIGERLREERERLGFTQPAFAGLAETTKKSQIDYEKDVTQPKAGYLAAITKVGADVQYIVTGMRSAQALTSDEQELLALFRAAPLEVKATIVAGLKGGVRPSAGSKISVGGSFHGQVVEGDVTNTVSGGMHIGGKDGEK
ncbi:hypothetical protein [Chromobacterium piscinae]|uniref:hypothetical protein n=1 Tax=Chromobacterium piscinae TaxID=686831 RepID=UPI003F80CE19